MFSFRILLSLWSASAGRHGAHCRSQGRLEQADKTKISKRWPGSLLRRALATLGVAESGEEVGFAGLGGF